VVNKEKIGRLRRAQGFQVRVRSARERAGISSVPPIIADVPNVLWAIDFQSISSSTARS
jgi:hypothetical protein